MENDTEFAIRHIRWALESCFAPWPEFQRSCLEKARQILARESLQTLSGDVAAIYLEDVERALAHAALWARFHPRDNGRCFLDSELSRLERLKAADEIEVILAYLDLEISDMNTYLETLHLWASYLNDPSFPAAWNVLWERR